MHYVISDLHGCYSQYKEMLGKINFSQKDQLYVIGDVLDRGPNPIEVLEHMISIPNIYPIMGNHESMALSTLRAIARGSNLIREEAIVWGYNENESSIKGFQKLHKKNQERIVKYIESFPMYRTIEGNGTTYVMVHAGFDYEDFEEEKPLEAYDWS